MRSVNSGYLQVVMKKIWILLFPLVISGCDTFPKRTDAQVIYQMQDMKSAVAKISDSASTVGFTKISCEKFRFPKSDASIQSVWYRAYGFSSENFAHSACFEKAIAEDLSATKAFLAVIPENEGLSVQLWSVPPHRHEEEMEKLSVALWKEIDRHPDLKTTISRQR